MLRFRKVLSPLCKQVHIAQQHADGNNFFVKVPRGVLLESSLNVGKIDFLQTIIEICIQHEFDIRMYQNSRYLHYCAITFSTDNCSNIHKGIIKLHYILKQLKSELFRMEFQNLSSVIIGQFRSFNLPYYIKGLLLVLFLEILWLKHLSSNVKSPEKKVYSRVFLLRQIWIVNYYVKNPVKNSQ